PCGRPLLRTMRTPTKSRYIAFANPPGGDHKGRPYRGNVGGRDAMRQPLVRSISAGVMVVWLSAAFCAGAGPAASAEQSPPVHHDLVATVDPASHHVAIRDRVRVPGALVTEPFTISLNAALHVQPASGGLRLVQMTSREAGPGAGADRNDRDPAS